MTDDPRLTRTALPLKLFDKDGNKVEITFRPFSDDDFVELNEWIRHEYMERLEDSLKGRSDRFISIAVQSAIAVVPTMSIFDKSHGTRLMTTPDGLAHALWIAARHDTEGLTKKQLVELLKDDGNQARATAAWGNANLGPSAADGGKAKQNTGESQVEKHDTD